VAVPKITAAITVGEVVEWVVIVGMTTLFTINRVRRFKALRRARRWRWRS
jgi:hypothetical protein